jgi:hypothetical protein
MTIRQLQEGCTMARHADLQAIVDRQDGSDAARARTAAFLRMAAGEATVEETALALGISTQRLHELRERMVAGAVAAAEPQAPGRPRSGSDADPRDARIAELEEQNAKLRFDLECAFLRSELKIVFGDRIPSLKKNAIHPGQTGEREQLSRRERRLRERRQRKADDA